MNNIIEGLNRLISKLRKEANLPYTSHLVYRTSTLRVSFGKINEKVSELVLVDRDNKTVIIYLSSGVITKDEEDRHDIVFSEMLFKFIYYDINMIVNNRIDKWK